MLSGFTFVRNAVKLDYPVIPAIRSILDICDEVVVNVGKSEDETRDLIAAMADPRIRIIDSVWDLSKGSAVLAEQTDRAMRACRGAWGVYIQADEVLHETGAAILKAKVQEWNADARVEGLLVRYLHFYGGFDTVATSRRWYRREVRCVRLGRDIRPYGDAQGFRVGAAHRKIRARLTHAEMFHYGWARPAPAIATKYEASRTLFPLHRERWSQAQVRPQLDWMPLLRQFTGAHPRVAQEWIAARVHQVADLVAPRQFRRGFIRYYLSDWVERLTGARPFEYRNYVQV